jgi:hypothetical protein
MPADAKKRQRGRRGAGSIEEVIPGKKYVITYQLPPSKDGKRQQKRETINGPKRAAQARLNAVHHTQTTGEYVEPTALTVEAWLEQWLKSYAKIKLKARSFQTTRTNLREHIIPRLGNIRLNQLTNDDLQAACSATRISQSP